MVVTFLQEISLTPNIYTFSGASPTEIGYLSGVTTAMQIQFGTCAKLAGATFTGAVTTAGLG